jgi:hypothetical protein
MLYVKRADVAIEAMQLKHKMNLLDSDGKEKNTGEPGDYLVTGILGRQYIVEQAVFEATYQSAETAK